MPFKHTVLALLIYYILFQYTFSIGNMTMEEWSERDNLKMGKEP